MKNKIGLLSLTVGLLAILSVVIISCKKDKVVTPDQTVSLFGAGGTTSSYLIPDDTNTVFKIGLGITKPSNADRTITFSISSPTGAAEGSQYTISSKTITIPAGKVVDSVSLKGIFAGYPTGRRDTLVFKITGGDIPALVGSDVYKVVMQKFCPLNMSVYSGNFEVVEDAWQDTFPGDIIELTAIDATHFSFIYPTAVNPVPIIVTVNPATNALTITKQSIGSVWVYGAQYTGPTAAASGTGNAVIPCDKVVSLNIQWGYSAGTFGGGPYLFKLVKK